MDENTNIKASRVLIRAAAVVFGVAYLLFIRMDFSPSVSVTGMAFGMAGCVFAFAYIIAWGIHFSLRKNEHRPSFNQTLLKATWISTGIVILMSLGIFFGIIE